MVTPHPILKAVCRGVRRPVAAKSGWTGHQKIPLPQAQIGSAGVLNDVIVDTDNHGGPDQAIYLLGEAERRWWEAELRRDLPPGQFGENLLIDGLVSADLAFGDKLIIGDLELQITAPRIPCATFAAVMEDKQALRRFFASARPGAYARVLKSGSVAANDAVIHIHHSGPRVGIVTHLDAVRDGLRDLAHLRACLAVPAHTAIHTDARRRLAEAGAGPISGSC